MPDETIHNPNPGVIPERVVERVVERVAQPGEVIEPPPSPFRPVDPADICARHGDPKTGVCVKCKTNVCLRCVHDEDGDRHDDCDASKLGDPLATRSSVPITETRPR